MTKTKPGQNADRDATRAEAEQAIAWDWTSGEEAGPNADRDAIIEASKRIDRAPLPYWKT